MQSPQAVLTVHVQREALCEEGLGVLGVGALARVRRVLGHHLEEVDEELVEAVAPLQIQGVLDPQLGDGHKSGVSVPRGVLLHLRAG